MTVIDSRNDKFKQILDGTTDEMTAPFDEAWQRMALMFANEKINYCSTHAIIQITSMTFHAAQRI